MIDLVCECCGENPCARGASRRGFLGAFVAGAAGLLVPRRKIFQVLWPAPAALPTLFDPRVMAAIQERTLARVWRDDLFPKLLFRMELETDAQLRVRASSADRRARPAGTDAPAAGSGSS